jgi:rSAM/selenodomain-associated transferase 2
VVIPTLNEADRIEAQLAATVAAVSPLEIVVVDGGSEDGTAAVVQASGLARLLHAPRGRAGQLNAGAAAAQGDILLFLHADVRLPQNADRQIEQVLCAPGMAAGAFQTRTVLEPSDQARPWLRSLLPIADLRSRYTRSPYGDQAMFVWRWAFESVGGYPDVDLMEDLAFSRAIRQCGQIGRAAAAVTVSGRRFAARPLYYATVMNSFPLLYALGVPPRMLAVLYPPER